MRAVTKKSQKNYGKRAAMSCGRQKPFQHYQESAVDVSEAMRRAFAKANRSSPGSCAIEDDVHQYAHQDAERH
jgi:hypothetical protein